MSHTPTPSTLQVEEYRVQLGAGHYHVVGSTTNEIGYFSRRSDAAHIVHCVNVHDQLVSALRQISEGNVMCNTPQYTHADTVHAYQQIAKAALATTEKGA